MRWMNLEPIIQSEVSQKEKNKYHILTPTYMESRNYPRWYRRNYFQGSNGEAHIENRLMGMGSGEERVRCMERVTWKLTLPYVK